MKTFLKKALPMFFAGLTIFAQAGYISEGGGDIRPSWYGAAWYLEKDPIQTCVELSPKFGLTYDQVLTDIQSAFKVWKTYLIVKRVSPNEAAFRPVSEISVLPSCNGQQELTIYLGTLNDEVEKAKKQFENPIAFVHRYTYDGDKARSKGFLWIADRDTVLPGTTLTDWTKKYNFHGIMLHEIGHLLGVPHVNGTIMDDGWLVSRLQSFSEEFRKASFTKVDYTKELLLERIDEVRYEGFGGPWPCSGDMSACSPEYGEQYEKLAGRKAEGMVRGSFGSKNGTLQVELRDDKGATTLILKRLTRPWALTESDFELQQNIFATWRNVNEGNIKAKGFSRIQYGLVDYYQLTDPTGKTHLAILERNSDTALSLAVVTPQGPIAIFHNDKYKMPY